MLFSSWKPQIIWVLFWCYPSALILGSYLKGLLILQWSHGTLTHGPRFSSRLHHQLPHCSRPVLLLSCPTTTRGDTETPLLLGLSLGFTPLCDGFWHIQGRPPSNRCSSLPFNRNACQNKWKYWHVKLCKHNKPCHGFLQSNPHHHPPTPCTPQLPMGITSIPQSVLHPQLRHFHSFIFSSPQILQAPSERPPNSTASFSPS